MPNGIMESQEGMNTGEGKSVGKYIIIFTVKTMVVISCEV